MGILSKTLVTGGLLVTLFAGSVPASAEQGRNAAAAAGAIGGFALGAMVGGAAPRPAPRTYYSGPGAFQVYEDDEPACRIVTRRSCDPYGCRTRRTEICE